MLDDFNLVVLNNAMPANLNVYVGAGATIVGFPDTFAEAMLLDLQTLTDIGAGNQLVARFDITESFTGSASSTFAFGVFSTDNPSIPHNPVHWLSRSMAFTNGGYVAGLSVELPIPSMDAVATQLGNGQRYLFLGMQVNMVANNFTTGKLTARFTINTKQDRRNYAVGYSIA
jgi:hypothetical protein